MANEIPVADNSEALNDIKESIEKLTTKLEEVLIEIKKSNIALSEISDINLTKIKV